ncbi:hypothetical protein [Streptomyces sp. NPDC056796]|uniref:hypothetical protein n=1 Tax=Streptomyces sp. NPDC056796 TaxID=3345947 RepID=UPI0036CC2FDA
MAGSTWEEALSLYTGGTPTTRLEVAGSGEGYASWFAGTKVDPAGVRPDSTQAWDLAVSIPWVDSDNALWYYQVGLKIAPEVGSNIDSALSRFMKEPIDWLYAATGEVGTDVVKLLSFDSAGMAARGMREHLMATHEQLISWAGTLDVPDAELQGSAAGILKDALIGVANEFEDLAVQMTVPHDFSLDIDQARSQLRDSTFVLSRAYETWRNSPGAWPAQRIVFRFWEAFQAYIGQPAQVTGSDTFTPVTPFGDPAGQEFWDRMEDQAKKDWTYGVVDNLDLAAVTELPRVEARYATTTSAIPVVTKPSWRTPNSVVPAGDASLPGYGTDPAKAAQDIADEAERARQEAESLAADASTEPSGSELPSGEGSFATDASTATADELSGTTPDSDRSLQDIVDGAGTGTYEATDATDAAYGAGIYPAGSVINGDGTVTGPGGTLLKNSDGSLVKAPAGAYERQQGQLRQSQALKDAAKAQEKQYQDDLRRRQQEAEQRATQQRAAEQSLQRARAVRTSGLDADALGQARSAKGSLRVKQPDGSYADYTRSGETARVPRSTAVRTSSGEGVVAEQAVGRRTSSSGSPMMPPMGGGAPAAGGQGQDRERKSYLDEDEDVWGTRRTNGTGVIG